MVGGVYQMNQCQTDHAQEMETSNLKGPKFASTFPLPLHFPSRRESCSWKPFGPKFPASFLPPLSRAALAYGSVWISRHCWHIDSHIDILPLSEMSGWEPRCQGVLHIFPSSRRRPPGNRWPVVEEGFWKPKREKKERNGRGNRASPMSLNHPS